MNLNKRVCVGEWARVTALDPLDHFNTYEGRITEVSSHRLTIYNDPAASWPNVYTSTGPVQLRKTDITAIEVALGK